MFALSKVTVPGVTPVSRWQFQTRYPYLSPHATPAQVLPATAKFGGGKPAIWRPGATALRRYQLGGGYTPGPLLAFCALAGLSGSAAALTARYRDLRPRPTERIPSKVGPAQNGAKSYPPANPAEAGMSNPHSAKTSPSNADPANHRPADSSATEPATEAGVGWRELALGSLLFFGCGAALLLMSDLFEFSWRYQLPALVTLPPAGATAVASFVRRRATGPARQAED